jgi:hypothetical protein
MNKFLNLILLLSLSTPGYAFSAGTLEIDVLLSPAGSYKAKTSEVEGSAYKTADGIAAENITADLSTLKTGIGLRDKHTRDRLDADKNPKAKLIKAIGKNGKGEAIIMVRGKKQKVEGTYTIEGDHVKADFPMKLSDLDIKDVRYMGVGVKDTVTVHVSVPLSAQRSAASKKK